MERFSSCASLKGLHEASQRPVNPVIPGGIPCKSYTESFCDDPRSRKGWENFVKNRRSWSGANADFEFVQQAFARPQQHRVHVLEAAGAAVIGIGHFRLRVVRRVRIPLTDETDLVV